MSAAEQFFNTNALLYLLSGDDTQADHAEQELSAGGVIGVQVLNEFASVASLQAQDVNRRNPRGAHDVAQRLYDRPISEETHDVGLQIAEKYELSVYDAMIVASALLAGCNTLLSEDLQHGQILDGRLKVRNPFR